AMAAQEKGLHVLGLSEHIFEMGEARPILEHMPLEGPLLTFPEYIEAVHAVGQLVSVDVRLGMEVDFIPGKNKAIQAHLAGHPWDFLIGSVHEIDGLQFEHVKNWDRAEGERLWLRYFELLRQAVGSGYFNLVSHPVRMRVKNPYLPPQLDEELEHLAAEAAQHDVALEINGYDVLNYPSLVQRLARACALHKTAVSVGSDAHYPLKVAQAHAQSEAILQEVGITKVRIWQQRAVEERNITAL
ncbi:MAG: PHP domain-containing protein, partial [Chloroflexota bacterium]|nr:PHP domain-containing protein [Chloroflexota bacterium]